ncbi:MAG: hypothetical protein GY869_29360, partial [Planctomycetes bacterium]|nr:hypothetical protein [Planctomycetota bacterium]
MRCDTKIIAVITLVAVFLTGVIGCSESSGTKTAEGTGSLQAAFVAPTDVDEIVVSLYLGTDATGPLVEERSLAGTTMATLFEDLHADNYYVVAEAKDSGDTVIYNGAG